MRFLDITAERFGVLSGAELNDLSPGLTVVYGANGSGKTTMVKFVEGLLFGYTTTHQAFQPDDSRFGGSASLQSSGRSYRVTRERSHGVTTELSTVDLATGVSVTAPDTTLPGWINHSIYDEIFSVGDTETGRFDLLTRLCLSGEGPGVSADEIRRVELAIDQCQREREGSGIEGGLRQQIRSLEQEKEDLCAQLNRLRQSDPRIPERIAAIEGELRSLQQQLAECDRRIREIEARIRTVEEQLAELRRRNVVSLNRREIENRISELEERQARWAEIRRAVNREIGSLAPPASGLRHQDSLQSVRALVSRLEERLETLSARPTDHWASVADRDVLVNHVRSEVYSLCDYLANHEAAVGSHDVVLESLFGQRTLQDAESVHSVLQGQIDALRDELQRSDDVLSVRPAVPQACPVPGHQTYLQQQFGHHQSGSIDALERELSTLRQQLETCHADRSRIVAAMERLRQELASLEARNRSVGTLEDVDRTKAQIAEIDASLVQLNDRWHVLEETQRQLSQTLDRLRQHKSPEVLELASTYIRRLTGGDCYRLETDAAATRILASTSVASTAQAVEHLSRGTRDQVALALRLALIQTRAVQGRCPLILDDVFISADDERAEAVADLLMEVASDGQQIIFFTCQRDVRALFERRNASIRYLEDRPVAAPVPAPIPVAVVPPPAPTPQPVIAENTNWLFYLEIDNSTDDLSGLTVAEVEAVRASGLLVIDDLLTLSLDDLEARIRNHGYSISRDRIRAWRGQAELATLVPMLRRADAELLYAAGIESTVELSRMRPETVFDMVSSFQNSTEGTRFRRSGRSIDRQQAINWSRWSQHARTLTDARRSRSRFFVRTTDEHNSPHATIRHISSADDRSADSARTIRQRRLRSTDGVTRTRRQPRPALSSSDRRELERRKSRRRERMQRHSSSYRTTAAETEQAVELRFFLSRSDDVEAAPSIGPKTAQRLGKTGVYTVDDLLNSDSEDVAVRLNNRRISADTIVSWQAQATLVCTVPELRGHDAQILVACGITEAEQLAGKRPADLFAVVGPFADTSEGERIIRNGKKPDLEEVTDWIRFAQQARSLKAAA